MPFAVIAITGILFLLVLLSLGFQPRLITRLTGWLMLFVGVSGSVIYGYGYAATQTNIPYAIMRSLFAVFGMFLGRNEISAVSQAPAFQSPASQIFIYIVHLTALYCTASAVLTAIGTRMLRLLNLGYLHRKDLNLIFGVSEKTMRFAENLPDDGSITVWVDADTSFEAKILRSGGIQFSDEKSLHPDEAFIKTLGMRPGKKKINVYCLNENPSENTAFACAMAEALGSAGILPEQSRLTMISSNNFDSSSLQYDPQTHRGFGSVYSSGRTEFIARLMVNTYPPYETMHFDGRGKATEDFNAVVIGFGSLGQAALRTLIMNGQFYGSTFHAAVIADSYSARSGNFFYRYPGLKTAYSIDFREENARSISFYAYLDQIKDKLNYVAVCTGDEKENAEIAEELTEYLRNAGSQAVVVQCSANGVSRLDPQTGLHEHTDLFAADVLNGAALDSRAKIINHQYYLNMNRTAEEDWKACDYFSRMSCRASADYMDAFLYACGRNPEDVPEAGWPQDAEVLENLAQAEHLRWMAFHYCMGYREMPEEVLKERMEQYAREKKEKGSSSLRVSKDAANRLHACLREWDALDDLSAEEYRMTGVKRDYKEMDRDNIRMIPAMKKTV